MRYALIGCGRIALNHIKAASKNKFEIVALCDINVNSIETLVERCHVREGINLDKNIHKYTNYMELLENETLDLIAIATESGSHAKIALDCINYGVNIIIEKPIAMSIQDADKIIYCSKEKGVKVSSCHQNRFNIAVQQLYDAVEKGRFGKISHGSIHIRWNRNHDYYRQALWRGTWEHDGGALMNQCIHGIDLLRWMFGNEVEEVYGATCQRLHDYIEAEDIGTAIIKFKSGALAMIEGTTNVYPENLEESLYIFGENGTAKIGGKSANNIDIWDFKDENKAKIENLIKEKTDNVYGNGHISLYKDMEDAIINDRNPYVDAIAGRNALELVLAIYKSQKENSVVKLPLKEFSTKDMIGEF